jgi:hypothetical protein
VPCDDLLDCSQVLLVTRPVIADPRFEVANRGDGLLDWSDLRHRLTGTFDDICRAFVSDAIDESPEVLGGLGRGDSRECDPTPQLMVFHSFRILRKLRRRGNRLHVTSDRLSPVS